MPAKKTIKKVAAKKVVAKKPVSKKVVAKVATVSRGSAKSASWHKTHVPTPLGLLIAASVALGFYLFISNWVQTMPQL